MARSDQRRQVLRTRQRREQATGDKHASITPCTCSSPQCSSCVSLRVCVVAWVCWRSALVGSNLSSSGLSAALRSRRVSRRAATERDAAPSQPHRHRHQQPQPIHNQHERRARTRTHTEWRRGTSWEERTAYCAHVFARLFAPHCAWRSVCRTSAHSNSVPPAATAPTVTVPTFTPVTVVGRISCAPPSSRDG